MFQITMSIWNAANPNFWWNMLKYIIKQVNYFAVLGDKFSAGRVRWHPIDVCLDV